MVGGLMPEEPSQRVKMLLVDDRPANLIALEAILSCQNYDCVKALSGLEALQQLASDRFALILLDVQMPDMDGFEVSRAIRSHPDISGTPIIFVTATAN